MRAARPGHVQRPGPQHRLLRPCLHPHGAYSILQLRWRALRRLRCRITASDQTLQPSGPIVTTKEKGLLPNELTFPARGVVDDSAGSFTSYSEQAAVPQASAAATNGNGHKPNAAAGNGSSAQYGVAQITASSSDASTPSPVGPGAEEGAVVNPAVDYYSVYSTLTSPEAAAAVEPDAAELAAEWGAGGNSSGNGNGLSGTGSSKRTTNALSAALAAAADAMQVITPPALPAAAAGPAAAVDIMPAITAAAAAADAGNAAAAADRVAAAAAAAAEQAAHAAAAAERVVSAADVSVGRATDAAAAANHAADAATAAERVAEAAVTAVKVAEAAVAAINAAKAAVAAATSGASRVAAVAEAVDQQWRSNSPWPPPLPPATAVPAPVPPVPLPGAVPNLALPAAAAAAVPAAAPAVPAMGGVLPALAVATAVVMPAEPEPPAAAAAAAPPAAAVAAVPPPPAAAAAAAAVPPPPAAAAVAVDSVQAAPSPAVVPPPPPPPPPAAAEVEPPVVPAVQPAAAPPPPPPPPIVAAAPAAVVEPPRAPEPAAPVAAVTPAAVVEPPAVAAAAEAVPVAVGAAAIEAVAAVAPAMPPPPPAAAAAPPPPPPPPPQAPAAAPAAAVAPPPPPPPPPPAPAAAAAVAAAPPPPPPPPAAAVEVPVVQEAPAASTGSSSSSSSNAATPASIEAAAVAEAAEPASDVAVPATTTTSSSSSSSSSSLKQSEPPAAPPELTSDSEDTQQELKPAARSAWRKLLAGPDAAPPPPPPPPPPAAAAAAAAVEADVYELEAAAAATSSVKEDAVSPAATDQQQQQQEEEEKEKEAGAKQQAEAAAAPPPPPPPRGQVAPSNKFGWRSQLGGPDGNPAPPPPPPPPAAAAAAEQAALATPPAAAAEAPAVDSATSSSSSSSSRASSPKPSSKWRQLAQPELSSPSSSPRAVEADVQKAEAAAAAPSKAAEPPAAAAAPPPPPPPAAAVLEQKAESVRVLAAGGAAVRVMAAAQGAVEADVYELEAAAAAEASKKPAAEQQQQQQEEDQQQQQAEEEEQQESVAAAEAAAEEQLSADAETKVESEAESAVSQQEQTEELSVDTTTAATAAADVSEDPQQQQQQESPAAAAAEVEAAAAEADPLAVDFLLLEEEQEAAESDEASRVDVFVAIDSCSGLLTVPGRLQPLVYPTATALLQVTHAVEREGDFQAARLLQKQLRAVGMPAAAEAALLVAPYQQLPDCLYASVLATALPEVQLRTWLKALNRLARDRLTWDGFGSFLKQLLPLLAQQRQGVDLAGQHVLIGLLTAVKQHAWYGDWPYCVDLVIGAALGSSRKQSPGDSGDLSSSSSSLDGATVALVLLQLAASKQPNQGEAMRFAAAAAQQVYVTLEGHPQAELFYEQLARGLAAAPVQTACQLLLLGALSMPEALRRTALAALVNTHQGEAVADALAVLLVPEEGVDWSEVGWSKESVAAVLTDLLEISPDTAAAASSRGLERFGRQQEAAKQRAAEAAAARSGDTSDEEDEASVVPALVMTDAAEQLVPLLHAAALSLQRVSQAVQGSTGADPLQQLQTVVSYQKLPASGAALLTSVSYMQLPLGVYEVALPLLVQHAGGEEWQAAAQRLLRHQCSDNRSRIVLLQAWLQRLLQPAAWVNPGQTPAYPAVNPARAVCAVIRAAWGTIDPLPEKEAVVAELIRAAVSGEVASPERGLKVRRERTERWPPSQAVDVLVKVAAHAVREESDLMVLVANVVGSYCIEHGERREFTASFIESLKAGQPAAAMPLFLLAVSFLPTEVRRELVGSVFAAHGTEAVKALHDLKNVPRSVGYAWSTAYYVTLVTDLLQMVSAGLTMDGQSVDQMRRWALQVLVHVLGDCWQLRGAITTWTYRLQWSADDQVSYRDVAEVLCACAALLTGQTDTVDRFLPAVAAQLTERFELLQLLEELPGAAERVLVNGRRVGVFDGIGVVLSDAEEVWLPVFDCLVTAGGMDAVAAEAFKARMLNVNAAA